MQLTHTRLIVNMGVSLPSLEARLFLSELLPEWLFLEWATCIFIPRIYLSPPATVASETGGSHVICQPLLKKKKQARKLQATLVRNYDRLTDGGEV